MATGSVHKLKSPRGRRFKLLLEILFLLLSLKVLVLVCETHDRSAQHCVQLYLGVEDAVCIDSETSRGRRGVMLITAVA